MVRAGSRGSRDIVQWIGLGSLILGYLCGVQSASDAAELEKASQVAAGRELFLREWLPHDSRAAQGDGLGPVFNDTSCIACHNLGGTGGAGPNNKNVEIVSAFRNPGQAEQMAVLSAPLTEQVFRGLFGLRPRGNAAKPKASGPTAAQLSAELAKVHPGFRSARSVVLHRFGLEPEYEVWRQKLGGPGANPFNVSVHQARIELNEDEELQAESAVPQPLPSVSQGPSVAQQERLRARFDRVGQTQSQHGNFFLITSQRNTTALFGVGLIDSIPDGVLEEAAKQRFEKFPRVNGRVARLADGKIGRFGWKAQKATLRQFAMTACAVELGLNVPEHPQAGLPHRPDYVPAGYDMTQPECDALVTSLRDLPAPAQTSGDAEFVRAGENLFQQTGCAACHTPRLGEVAGIYSDLLVHDMGPELGDTGDYGTFIPSEGGNDSETPLPELAEAFGGGGAGTGVPGRKIVGTQRLEWRTPPLWGVRDSGPYLHDGRADTLEQAIAHHGGEAEESSQEFFALSREERLQVLSFLRSLTAPDEVATAHP